MATGSSSRPRAERVHLHDPLDGGNLDVGRDGHRDAAAAHPLRPAHALDQARARRVAHEEPERVRGTDERLTGEAALGRGASSRRNLVLGYTPDGWSAGLERRRNPAAAASRHAADMRAKAGRPRGAADVARVEHDGARGGDSGRHRRSDQAEKADVDRTVAELGVEAGRDISARAQELPLHARTGDARSRGDDDPRPVHGDALLEASALVRRECRRRCGSKAGRDHGQDEQSLHGTLLNQNIESNPPVSNSAAEPPAKTSVTSRDLSRWPSREPRSSYTFSRSSSSVAVKNSPPDASATCRRTSGSGGTWIRWRRPPGSSSSTTPFSVPTSTV